MRRSFRSAFGAVLAVGATLAASVVPAAARTSGKESFHGVVLAASKSGTRNVFSTMIVASGAFTGAGKIVETENRPGDPDNVTRDDLVFPQGRLHIRNANRPPTVSVDQQTCEVTGGVKQTTVVQGGTRRFRDASGTFAGIVQFRAVAARNPNGTCNLQAELLLETNVVSARGTLSF